jgi:hypothetical protein
MRTTRDAGARSRTVIVLHAAAEKDMAEIVDAVRYDPSVALKVLHTFRAAGEDGWRNHRAQWARQVDDGLRAGLATLLVGSPENYDWARPTWTQELLARQSGYDTRVRVSASTVGRMLADLGERCGMVRATVACPWGSRRQARRVWAIERRLARLPAGEETVLCGRSNIHLHPRIGRDWMLPGDQKSGADTRAESERLRGRRAAHADGIGVLDRQWTK